MQQMTSQYMAASSEQQAANADAAQPIGGQLAEQRAAAQDDVVRMNAQGGELLVSLSKTAFGKFH